ncbi:unnamed protein product [Protopolystoma xenopodis]|uniref:Uncharacterized protein n=1 Tax=Protopolystoma xenopodis TaxID=117903 RepID=A0A3S5CP47_9PLAT|nr:unnamed protein product [Protopolystoma xenopodis]
MIKKAFLLLSLVLSPLQQRFQEVLTHEPLVTMLNDRSAALHTLSVYSSELSASSAGTGTAACSNLLNEVGQLKLRFVRLSSLTKHRLNLHSRRAEEHQRLAESLQASEEALVGSRYQLAGLTDLAAGLSERLKLPLSSDTIFHHPTGRRDVALPHVNEPSTSETHDSESGLENAAASCRQDERRGQLLQASTSSISVGAVLTTNTETYAGPSDEDLVADVIGGLTSFLMSLATNEAHHLPGLQTQTDLVLPQTLESGAQELAVV